jgi:hypothetical protein
MAPCKFAPHATCCARPFNEFIVASCRSCCARRSNEVRLVVQMSVWGWCTLVERLLTGAALIASWLPPVSRAQGRRPRVRCVARAVLRQRDAQEQLVRQAVPHEVHQERRPGCWRRRSPLGSWRAVVGGVKWRRCLRRGASACRDRFEMGAIFFAAKCGLYFFRKNSRCGAARVLLRLRPR